MSNHANESESPFHTAIQFPDRYFSKEIRYRQIDFDKNNFAAIVFAFKARIDDWYIRPAQELAKDGHNAFALAGICCLLIDCLSQYYSGKTASNRAIFKCFTSEIDSVFGEDLNTKIPPDPNDKNNNKFLTKFCDVLYHAFRCDILHEANIPPYCQILPSDPAKQQKVIEQPKLEPTDQHYSKTQDGAKFPAVTLYPQVLLKKLTDFFNDYIFKLLDPSNKKDQDSSTPQKPCCSEENLETPSNQTLRDNFKKKFKVAFGIDIDNAELPGVS